MLLRSLVAVSTGLLLCACAGVSRLESGGVVAFGEPVDGADRPLYYLIRIDARRPLDAHTGNALVKLAADAPSRSIADLEAGWVARHLPAFEPPAGWPDTWKKRARRLQAFQGGGYYVAFEEGRLVSLELCSHCAGGREAPRVGAPGGLLFALPLTERQLTEVFGPFESRRRVREVTY